MLHPQNIIADVKAADYLRFLAIQLAPQSARPALYALTAFNLELARIAETVSEPMLGHIRLAWWREALDELAAGRAPRRHPVVEALATAHTASPQLLPLLQESIDARAADLDESLLTEEGAWLGYLDHTAGAMARAWALVLHPALADAEAPHIAAAARAYAMVGHARAIPYFAAQGFLRFPAARLQQAGVTELQPSGALERFTQRLVEDAAPGLAQPLTLAPLRALSRLAQVESRALQRAGYDPFRVHVSRPRQVWALIAIK